MVLKVLGSSLAVSLPPNSLNDFLMSSKAMRERAREFKDKTKRVVKPEDGEDNGPN